MEGSNEKISRFVQDRNNAFRSLDKGKIMYFIRKYSLPNPLPANQDEDIIFWTSIHLGRIQIQSFTRDEKILSIKWLRDHNVGSMPDTNQIINLVAIELGYNEGVVIDEVEAIELMEAKVIDNTRLILVDKEGLVPDAQALLTGSKS